MKKGNNLANSTNLFAPLIPNDTVISFLGVIDSNAEAYLITQIESYLDSIKSSPSIKSKIMEISIELLQNILHHSPQLPLDDKITGNTFQLEKSKDGHIITTSNYITSKHAATLTKRIEYLNSLTRPELINLYRNIIDNGNAVRETAGLGLIDIRRKSGKPIYFMFAAPVKLDNNYSLFTVKVLV